MAVWHETMSDTIVARATPSGVAALAIVRLSGIDAIRIAESILQNVALAEAKSHTVHVGYVQSESGAPVDQVVATVFRGPHSATGQDVVEITCHGGHLLPGRIVRLLTSAGARPATAGEFTQRAFLNGKIDLAQAESVAELIHADSTQAGDISVQHLQGRYSELLESIRTELTDAAALIELELDFSEEDVEFADRDQFEQLLSRARTILDELVSSYRFGRLAREGIRVVIAGRPNAGKSTLLNAFLGYERAIVSETAGTTRDSIEAEVEYEGLRIKFVDTAGIRETGDEIESEGVRRSHREIAESDVVLYLYDVREGLTAQETSWLASGDAELGDQPGAEEDDGESAPHIVVIANKMDLIPSGGTIDDRPEDGTRADFTISATEASRNAALLDELIECVLEHVRGGLSGHESHRTVLLERHHKHLSEALDAVSRTREALDRGATGDLLAIDIRTALDHLGMITGSITNEDVLDQIFSRFCIGK